MWEQTAPEARTGWPTSVRQWIATGIVVALLAGTTYVLTGTVVLAVFAAIAGLIVVRLRFSRIGRWSFVLGYLAAGIVSLGIFAALLWLVMGPLGAGKNGDGPSGTDFLIDLATLLVVGAVLGLAFAAFELVFLAGDARPDSETPALEDRFLPENRWARGGAIAGLLALSLGSIGWFANELGPPAAYDALQARVVVTQQMTPLHGCLGSGLFDPGFCSATYTLERVRELLTARGRLEHRRYDFADAKDDQAQYDKLVTISNTLDAHWWEIEAPFREGEAMYVDVWGQPDRMPHWHAELAKLGGHIRE